MVPHFGFFQKPRSVTVPKATEIGIEQKWRYNILKFYSWENEIDLEYSNEWKDNL